MYCAALRAKMEMRLGLDQGSNDCVCTCALFKCRANVGQQWCLALQPAKHAAMWAKFRGASLILLYLSRFLSFTLHLQPQRTAKPKL